MTRSTRTKGQTSEPLAAVILAAGEGKRMKSKTAKVLHRACGRSLVEHVARAAIAAGASPVVTVVGVQSETVTAELQRVLPDHALFFAEQTERLGTGDAVGRARTALKGFAGDCLILCGDVPALGDDALRALVAHHRRSQAALTILTAEVGDPTGYGRIVRTGHGQVEAIVEHKDASPEVRRVREINTGTYCARWKDLAAAIDRIRPDNAQGEYYLTDAVRLLLERGLRVEALVHPRFEECLGVNSRIQLAEVTRIINRRLLEALMADGVTVVDPGSTWVDADVVVGRDSTLYPGVTLERGTRIGPECVIRSGSRLSACTVGAGATIKDHTVAEDSLIGRECSVGPSAHLRPGTVLDQGCKIGNFVETKKATFGRGSKASHLSYVGDAIVGKDVNIGAGTITCNYDGVNKHVTKLEDGVFVGSDTQFVAPITVGKGAYVGAGSTITKDIPPGALGLTRATQQNLEGWVARKKARQKAPKPK